MNEVSLILAKQAAMEATRGPWENHWRECAELMLPRQDDFFGKRQPGEMIYPALRRPVRGLRQRLLLERYNLAGEQRCGQPDGYRLAPGGVSRLDQREREG